MPKNLQQKALNGIAWSLLDQIVNKLGYLILLIYLSRVLTPADFGLIAMLTIFLAISQSIADSGFSHALVQKSSKATESDFSTVFYINIFMALILYGLLYFSAPFISEFYNAPELTMLSRVLFLMIIINAFSIVPKSKLIIKIDFKSQSLINTAAMLASVVVTIYMVNENLGYWALVGMNLSKALFSSVLLFLYSKWFPREKFSRKSFKSLFSFGSKLLLTGLLSTITQNLYIILIGRYFNPTQVGYFQQGFNYTNLLSGTVTSVIQGVTYPIMTSIQEDKERLVKLYIRVMGLIALVTFPIFIGFAAVSEEFVLIFLGEKWIPIIPILIILSFARLITPISSLNLNILNARGRSDLFLKTDLSKIPMIILALLISVPYGITAVAVAQLITTVISFFINAYYPGKLFGFGSIEQLKQIFPVSLASLFMYECMMFVDFESVEIQMLVKILIGVISYLIACKVLKVEAYFDLSQLLLKKFRKVNKI